MSLTNAAQHQHTHGKGAWLTTKTRRRCSHYFGTIHGCAELILPGQRYFDTQEPHPESAAAENYVVCGACGKTPHSANFLQTERRTA
jgi:hypothetical protein